MYKTIIPATDWFFVHEGHDQKPNVCPLAAWGLTDEGATIGLLATSERTSGGNLTLTAVPPIEGRYLHRDQLTKEERALHAVRSNLAFQRKAPTPIDDK
ncbi:hypothetical protein [Burkholderia gladioli]|uniref:hypothetical protein n=1 Tax=Burkholderia gladioli TaxID=28095 RepID=UPI003D1D4404